MKKRHRFLIPQHPSGDTLSLETPEIVHQIRTVLKLKEGEECILFSNESDDYVCTIKTIEPRMISFRKESIVPKKNIPKQVTACISITKRDTFELIVQKATELGVHTIIPLLSDRTIKQSLRIDRLQKISDEALEQSGGSHRVTITEPLSLEEALEHTKDTTRCLFDMDGARYTPQATTSLSYFIGPEGGWTEAERALFEKADIPVYTLGATTLRAETAAIVGAYTLLWE